MAFDRDAVKSKLVGNSWTQSPTKTGLTGYVSLYSDRSDMDQLTVRCRTYLLWPGWVPRSVDPSQLAEAGLYFTGEEDAVRCYRCRETFAGWKDGDVPLDVHRRRCPTCPAVVSLDRRRPPSSSDSDVKFPDDVDVDCAGELTCKTAAEDFVDVGTRPANHFTRSRGTVTTTTNLTTPGNITLTSLPRPFSALIL